VYPLLKDTANFALLSIKRNDESALRSAIFPYFTSSVENTGAKEFLPLFLDNEGDAVGFKACILHRCTKVVGKVSSIGNLIKIVSVIHGQT
jgi:hypothetical protein